MMKKKTLNSYAANSFIHFKTMKNVQTNKCSENDAFKALNVSLHDFFWFDFIGVIQKA